MEDNPAIEDEGWAGYQELLGHEFEWAKRHDFLLQRGYRLRPRYRPGWKPSWTTPAPILTDEDAITQKSRGDIMDAERLSDSSIVMMKSTEKNGHELDITSFLSSSTLREDPRNHCVPLLDVSDDPLDSNRVLMVFPLLRKGNEPKFSSIGDCIDFIEQTLEGLAFMHEHNVAHRDCFDGNIMMEGRALYPNGWHPQQPHRNRDGSMIRKTPQRKSIGGVRYYFIDFGISTHGLDMATGDTGQRKAPELSTTVAYDPYKVDIFVLGELFKLWIVEKYQDFCGIKTLTDEMTLPDPHLRPTASECLERFNLTKNQLSRFQRARRLQHAKPSWKIIELVKDLNYLALEGYWSVRPPRKSLSPYVKSVTPENDVESPET